jgi:hypothetical protein
MKVSERAKSWNFGVSAALVENFVKCLTFLLIDFGAWVLIKITLGAMTSVRFDVANESSPSISLTLPPAALD